MSSTVKVSLLLFGVFILGSGLIVLAGSPLIKGVGPSAQDGSYQNPEAQIDQKAAAIKGADEHAIRELADALFHVPSLVSIPENIARPFKERLVRSEISYRQDQSKGIPEENLVRVIDELAQKFDAPDYARTSQDEVRDLRLMISYSMPHFIPRQPASDKTDTEQRLGFSVSPLMSPLEAIYVAQALILQKEINEYFQVTQTERVEIKATLKRLDDQFHFTPEERAAVAMALIQQKFNSDMPQRAPEELAALAKKRSAERGSGSPQATLSVKPSSLRQKEMQEVMQRANSMKVKEALALSARLLSVLGV